MSKPKHKFRGVPYMQKFTQQDRALKKQWHYHFNVLRAHRAECKKIWHIERGKIPFPGAGFCDEHVQNAKIRPVVQKRINKLATYARRSWIGLRKRLGRPK